MDRVAFVCPGQGAYFRRAAEVLWDAVPATIEVFAEIDRVAAELGEAPVRPVLFGTAASSIDELAEQSPESLQLALYGLAVAAFHGLRERGAVPWAVIGHSIGEIPALVCAGAYTVAEGAEISWRRVRAVRRHAGAGTMLAIGADAEVAAALVRAVDDPLAALAVRSAPRQSVVSGPHATVTTIGELADWLGRWNRPVASPFAFHSPLMAAAVEPFRSDIEHIRQKPLRTEVYSTTLGRRLTDDDRFADVLASGLVRRCDLLGVVREAHARGAGVFVECGARDILARTVREIVPDVATAACLVENADAETSLTAAARTVRHSGPGTAASGTTPIERNDRPEPAADAPERQDAQPTSATAAAPAADAASEPPPTDRASVLADVRAMYATVLEYPEEVLEEDADLDADLGVDSLKQTDLLARVAKKYGFAHRSTGLRMSDYPTLGRIADLVAETGRG